MQIYAKKDKINFLQVWLIVFGLLGYELISFIPDWLKLDSRVVTVPYRGFFFCLCLISISRLMSGRRNRLSPLMVILLCFWTLYLMRLFYDTFFTTAEFARPVGEYWLYAVGLSFVPIFAYRTTLSAVELHKGMVYSFCLAAIINLLGLYSNLNSESLDTYRLGGNEFLNPITYGQTGTMLILLGICLLLDFQEKIKWVYILIIVLLMVVGLVNIALAGSRGPFVQMLISISLLAVVKLRRKYWLPLIILSGFLLVASMFINSSIPIFDILFDRINTTGGTENMSDNLRLQVLDNSWNGFLEHPLFGAWFEEKKLHMYPHNFIVEAFMSTGIFGGLLMVAIYILSFQTAIGLLKTRGKCWIGLLCIVSLIAGFTTGSLWGSFKFWELITLADGLKEVRRIRLPDVSTYTKYQK